MTIANVVRAENSVQRLVAGVPSTLTIDPVDDISQVVPKYNSAVHRMTAWFEGRLYTARTRDQGTLGAWDIRRWDNANAWEDPPTGVLAGLMVPASAVRHIPGLITVKDRVYLFFDRESADTPATSNLHQWNWISWEPNPATTGATDTGSLTGRTYTKTGGVEDHGHILDLIEYFGQIYVATPVNTLVMTVPNGNLSFVDPLPAGGFDTQTTKSFAKFTPPSSSLALLYQLNADGKVYRVQSSSLTMQEDLTGINAGITAGNSSTAVGFGCKLIAIENQLFAFLNDSTGTVLFKSSDGVSWTEETASLPTPVKTINTHIKGEIDPSDGGGTDLARIMFVNDSNNAYSIYEFDGTTFTELPPGGSASGEAIMSYTFFDQDAADVEIEASPTIDTGAGEASLEYRIFNQTGLTATVTVVAEYSVDEGSNWLTATAAAGSGLGSETLTGLSASDTRTAGNGTAYTFVWDYATDVGTGLIPNARLRIRSV